MKLYIFIIMIAASVCFGCREIYEPRIKAQQDILVVEGLLTDETKPYTVKLSMAERYDSNVDNSLVSNAEVAIIDDNGMYSLSELEGGVYKSDPAILTGQPGQSYHLRIKTTDGNVYESTPQLLLPNQFADTTYAEFSSQESLVEDGLGGTSKIVDDGVDLLVDIANNADSIPRFRYQTIVTTEYSYFVVPIGPNYLCWETTFPNKLVNLTESKYQTSSTNIEKHLLGFIPTYYRRPFFLKSSNEEVYAHIVNRIIKVIRYRINKETFQFYKNINTLLSAEGKIFDPIAFQLQGNITCKNNPQKLVFGFFEASSVKTSLYAIKPGEKKVEYGIKIEPPLDGDCVVNDTPKFWVY